MDWIVEQKIELSNHTRGSGMSKTVPHSLLEMFLKEHGNRLVTGVSRNFYCEKVWVTSTIPTELHFCCVHET